MEILLILILLVLTFGTSKLGNAVGGCLSAVLGLIILGVVFTTFNKIISEIGMFIETYGWIVFGLLSLTLVAFIILILYVIGGVLNKKDLSLSFLDAVSRNETAKALRILKGKPNVNIRNSMKWTPLILASRKGNLELVRALIKSKAKVNCKNAFGDTAYVHAKYKGYDDIANLLVKAGAKKTKPSHMVLISCVVDNNTEGVRRCLLAKLSPNPKSQSGESAFELAIRNNNTVMVAYLIKYGAVPNSREMQAGQYANPEIKQMLKTGMHLKYINEYEKMVKA